MDKVTLKFDLLNMDNRNLQNYLLSIDGISEVFFNASQEEITIGYIKEKITLRIIFKEILLYLDSLNFSSILLFDKHNKDNIKNDIIRINNLCCEYCLSNFIEELMYIDGINSAYSNYDFHNKNKVLIYVSYDKKTISREFIESLEKKFNNYVRR